MEKTAYNQQKLRAYLVGALAEDEAEIFDELSFTDDSFAEELNAAEKDLVDIYVRGELAGAELENFKNHYLASPMRREKIEFAGAFQIFAEQKIAETEKEATEEKTKRSFGEILKGLDIFGGFRYALQFGFAAAVLLLMIAGGWLWSENRRLTEQAGETERRRERLLQREQELQKQLETEQSRTEEIADELARLREERQRLEELNREKEQKEQIIAEQKKAERQRIQLPSKQPSAPSRLNIASFILAPPLRGGSQIPNLSVPPKTDAVAAQLQLEADDYPAYRVALVNQTGQTLWQSGRLKAKKAGAGKVLSVRFPAKLLKSGIYSLNVSGIGTDGAAEEISSYPIRVVLD